MSIIRTKVPREVVIRDEIVTDYECDKCGLRYRIGQFNQPNAVNSLHPPRLWWQLAPADVNRSDHREVQHFCSLACLQDAVSQLEVAPWRRPEDEVPE